jgi:predicted GTPase
VNTIVQVSTHSLTYSLTYLLTYLLTCYPAEQDRLKRIKLQEEKIANEKAEEDRKQADELQKAINFSNELGDFTSFFTHLLAHSLTYSLI